jgi:hypothetical protein
MNLRKGAIAVMVLIVALYANEAEAQIGEEFTGNDLWEICRDEDVRAPGFCSGYIVGVLNALAQVHLAGVEFPGKFCLPGTGTLAQVVETVITLLRDRPEVRHMPAFSITGAAISARFPCR